MSIFYIDMFGSFILLECESQEIAEQWAQIYYGNLVKSVEPASDKSLEYSRQMKGEIYNLQKYPL